MILKGFLAPKWQHEDPAVRRRAVEALTGDDVELLTRIALEDAAADVRRAALNQLSDLDLLHRVSAKDKDEKTRQFARGRLLELLAGTPPQSPNPDLRSDFLSRYPEDEFLEFVALNAAEPEFRRFAQDRATRESLLCDVAIGDAIVANRQAALERITDPSILETIVRKTLKSDKQIHRHSQERLDAIREAEARSAQAKAEAERICTTLESMGQGDQWQQELEELQHLDNGWQAIEEEIETVFHERRERARDAFMKASETFREARENEQRRWAAALASRQTLLLQATQLSARVQDAESLSTEEEKSRTSEMESLRISWHNAGDAPVSEGRLLNKQFEQELTLFHQRLERLVRERATREALQSTLAEAQRLMDSKQPVLEREVKSLEKQWKEYPWPEGSDQFKNDLERLEEIDGKLRKRLVHQREQRQKKLEQLPTLIDQLDALMKENRIKEAAPLHDRIQSSIDHLQALGVPREQLQPYTRKFHSTDPQLLELRSWQAWGADEVRQRLCAEMQSLIGSEIDPKDLAVRIRHLRSEWNQLRSDGGTGFRALRKRFDKAASEAYKPCEIYYNQQAEARKQNLELKEGLLQKLDAFLETADWSDMEWKTAVRFQRKITNDWRHAGPVDRRKARQIEKNFQKRMAALNEQLAIEHARNVEQRKELIDRVRGLLEIENINRAINECKELQTQWLVTVPGKRKKENAIWREFREACDAVFMRRKQEQEARHEIEEQARANRKQLCEQLEGLSSCTLSDLEDAVHRSHKILGQWKASGFPAKRDADLQKRFERAEIAFQKHTEAIRDEDAQAQLEQLKTKAAYCLQAEALLELPGPEDAMTAFDALEKQWNETLPLRDDGTEQAVQARFQKVKTALLEGAEQRDRLLSELRENLEKQKQLCLRMEILTGAESPPEAQQARLEFQTARLAQAISRGSEDPIGGMAEIQREWYLMGGAPADQEKALQSRFDRAERGTPG